MKNNESKTNITKEVVEYVARLSRLSFEGKELEGFRQQLAGIIEYIEQLNEVDTSNVTATTHVLPSMKNVFREDEEKRSLSQDLALENAPASHNNHFTVPKII